MQIFFIPDYLNLIINIIILLIIIKNLIQLPWKILAQNPFTYHLFFISTIAITLLWLMRIGMERGLLLHLSGITALTLIMGKRLALIAGSLAYLLLILLNKELLISAGINILLLVLLPIKISYWFYRLLEKKLPKNPFVFVLGAGFFGGMISLVSKMIITAMMFYFFNIYQFEIIWKKYLMFMPIIIYPEGFLNGLAIAVMVAFYHDKLSCFNPDYYLK